jgi:hypothetical protein
LEQRYKNANAKENAELEVNIDELSRKKEAAEKGIKRKNGYIIDDLFAMTGLNQNEYKRMIKRVLDSGLDNEDTVEDLIMEIKKNTEGKKE